MSDDVERRHDGEDGCDRREHAAPVGRGDDHHRERGETEQLGADQHFTAVNGYRPHEDGGNQQHERELDLF